MGSGTVTFDAEEYAKAMDELKALLTDGAAIEKRLRDMGLKGFSGGTTRPPSPDKKNESDAMQIQLDISGIDWKTKTKEPAGPDAPWCWAHGFTKDGGIRRETAQLVAAIEQYGRVQIGKYEYTLGGRDDTLLNRRVRK